MNATTLTSVRADVDDDLRFLSRADAGWYGDTVRDALRGLTVQPHPDDVDGRADAAVADDLITAINTRD